MIRLSRLWESAPPPEQAVAFGREGWRSASDLRADVSSLAARLAPAAGGRVLLHCADAYAFAVGLLAAAQVGARAVLPPSSQPAALRRLTSSVAGAIVDDADTAATIDGCPTWHPLKGERAVSALSTLDRNAPFVELFTSGTTRDEHPVTKALRHLEDEVVALEQRFGGALGDSRVLATMSPQHLYGLLFRVLWPIASGRPFLRTATRHPEELAPYLAGGACALAATPVALRHLVEKGLLRDAASTCRAVFSSGGPLPPETARRVAEALGAPPHEVYGSTETGGIAVRQQHRGGESWRTLPGVEVASSDERLAVTSPFVSAGEPLGGGRERRVLEDRVRFEPDGGFTLLGRADRTVKVGDKRLSLPQMEETLRLHPAVDDTRLVTLELGGDARVGAVIVPSPAGREIVAAGGRRALAKALGEHLASEFDRVLLPRAWRIVEALPYDAQDKTPAKALLALFSGSGGPRVPEQLALRREDRVLEAELRVPEDLAFLEGHFPGQPVVAGVVQVHFAMQALGDLLGEPPRVQALEALKFRELLLPGQRFRLRLELDEGGSRFAFALCDPDQPERVFSSGAGRLGARA